MKGGVSFAGHKYNGDKMKGYFALEALFLIFLFPYLFYLSQPEDLVIVRETAEIAQDIAQLYSYNYTKLDIEGYIYWIDGSSEGNCSYKFKYCTTRFIGKEVEICAAECLR